MSLLSDIKKFSAKSLKATETVVTTTDGRRLVETHDITGKLQSRPLEGSALGFVGDYKPDLQVGQVRPYLFVGSQDVAADASVMTSHGVTHILNLAVGVEQAFPGEYLYKSVQIMDLPETRITDYFDECFAFITSASGQHSRVLVHCNAGVSRAPTIVTAYLMYNEKLDFQKAFDQVKSARPSVRPNDGFLKQLKDYKP